MESMTQSEHPGERLLNVIKSVIEKSGSYPFLDNSAKGLWCQVHGKNVSDTAGFVESIRQFQSILDEWRRDSLIHSHPNSNYVNKIYNDLNNVMLDLGGFETRDEFVAELRSLETAIGMGVIPREVYADFEWGQDQLEELQAEVVEWRDRIIASPIDPIWKRNIIEALENVLEAIADHEVRGNNHLTDAVIKFRALLNLPQVAIRLSQIGMEIGSWAIDKIDRIGGLPALPPGGSE